MFRNLLTTMTTSDSKRRDRGFRPGISGLEGMELRLAPSGFGVGDVTGTNSGATISQPPTTSTIPVSYGPGH